MSGVNTDSENAWDIRHRIRIPALKDGDDSAALEVVLASMPGMRKVDIDTGRHRVMLTYDASRLGWPEIDRELKKMGYPPADNPWGRIKTGWFSYVDANIRRGAKAPPPACCNKPPK